MNLDTKYNDIEHSLSSRNDYNTSKFKSSYESAKNYNESSPNFCKSFIILSHF